MMHKKHYNKGLLSDEFVLYLLVLALTYLVYSVAAQSTTSTYQVTIGNMAPYMTGIVCAPFSGNAYSPPGSTNYSIWCNVTANDQNGYQDIKSVNMTYFHEGTGTPFISPWDLDVLYRNTTGNGLCTPIAYPGATQAIYACSLRIVYWADNGSWNVTFQTTDGQAGNMTSYSNTLTINPSIGIDQTGTINFGGMTLGGNGTGGWADKLGSNATTINMGNMRMNLRVNADNGNMSCSVLGNISIERVHYNRTNQDYYNGYNLWTDIGQTGDTINNTFYLKDGDSTPGSLALQIVPQNVTAWGIGVPSAGVSGTCQVTVTFTSQAAP